MYRLFFKEEELLYVYTEIIGQNESKDNFIFIDTFLFSARIIKIHEVDKDGNITHTLYNNSKDDRIYKIKYEDLENKSYDEILSYIEEKTRNIRRRII